MNSRELFTETMSFNPAVGVPKWEFGYWGATIKNWYCEGLPQKNYPKIPANISTISASLYTTAWAYRWRDKRETKKIVEDDKKEAKSNIKIELPNGIGVWGGALYWPSQGFPLDKDVAGYFNFDKSEISVNVEQIFWPHFNIKILDEDEKSLTYIDLDGVKRKYLKKEATIPTSIDWPIKDWDSWNSIKEQRLGFDNISSRFPKNWPALLKEYRRRDYPLALGGYPLGLFGTLAHLIGYENLFYFYYDSPNLIHDILTTFTNLWISIWEEVVYQVDVDCVHIWEDVSSGRGSMISKAIFREFMTPYYKKLTSFLKSKGVNIILVDTDGNCSELIPLFLEAGITGLYPMEVSAGMDVISARRKYPNLQIMGGIPKSDIALGEKRIDEILVDTELLLKGGGYIPFGDHLIPPEVPWKYFKYYRERLNGLIDKIF